MSEQKPQLKLDWCNHEAAKYAVEHWHYSRSLPTPPIVRIGVWEDGSFIGCVLFSRGANNNLGSPYGLKCTEICELTRVALSGHKTPVSKIVSVAIKLLRKHAQGLRLIISFADPNEGHVGTIYQAGGWLYCGRSKSTPKYQDRQGRIWHQRQVSKTGVKPQYGKLRKVAKSDDCIVIPQLDKYRYLLPLDEEMKQQTLPLSKPYPKKPCATSIEGDASSDPTGRGRVNATVALLERVEEVAHVS